MRKFKDLFGLARLQALEAKYSGKRIAVLVAEEIEPGIYAPIPHSGKTYTLAELEELCEVLIIDDFC